VRWIFLLGFFSAPEFSSSSLRLGHQIWARWSRACGCCAPVSAWKFRSSIFPDSLRCNDFFLADFLTRFGLAAACLLPRGFCDFSRPYPSRSRARPPGIISRSDVLLSPVRHRVRKGLCFPCLNFSARPVLRFTDSSFIFSLTEFPSS
jgi:hypothetical protein